MFSAFTKEQEALPFLKEFPLDGLVGTDPGVLHLQCFQDVPDNQ